MNFPLNIGMYIGSGCSTSMLGNIELYHIFERITKHYSHVTPFSKSS